MPNNFNSISPLTTEIKRNPTDARTGKFEEFSRQQAEGYQEELRQLHKTVENLNGEIKKLKEAHIIELTEKDAVSKKLKENHIIEIAKKNNEIETLKEAHIIEIKTLKEVQKSSIEADKFDAVLAKLDTLHATVRTIPVEIITEVSKISTTQTDRILSGMAELPDADEFDAIIKNRLSDTDNSQTTMIVSEMPKFNIPKPVDSTILLSEIAKVHESILKNTTALENIKNVISGGLQYLCKGEEGIVEPIKRHIDLLPKPQPVDITKIEQKLEVIEDNTNYLVNETDDIKEIVETLKQESVKPLTFASNSNSTSNSKALNSKEDESVKPLTFDLNSNLNSNSDKQESVKSLTSNSNSNSKEDESVKPLTFTSNSNSTTNSKALNSNEDESVKPLTFTQNQKKIIAYIKKNPGKTNKEISEGTDIVKTTVSAVLKLLIEMDIVILKGKGYYLKS